MSGVRLSNKKISSILDRQSKLEAELEVNLHDEDGWKALEQLQEQAERENGAWGLVLVVASGLVCTGECPASILLRGEVPGVWR